MFETDSVPSDWLVQLEQMDAIWVPSAFHVDTFARAGVARHKLRVVPEAVDVREFDPHVAQPVKLPEPRWPDAAEPAPRLTPAPVATADDEASGGGGSGAWSGGGLGPSPAALQRGRNFNFLSVFKWEPRKGWPILLEAFLTEFTVRDRAVLYILSRPFAAVSEETIRRTVG